MEKGELDKRITLISLKISYYLLLVLMVVVLFLTEGATSLNGIRNLPLVTVIGLAFAIQPLTEFFISRKFQ